MAPARHRLVVAVAERDGRGLLGLWKARGRVQRPGAQGLLQIPVARDARDDVSCLTDDIAGARWDDEAEAFLSPTGGLALLQSALSL